MPYEDKKEKKTKSHACYSTQKEKESDKSERECYDVVPEQVFEQKKNQKRST